MSAIVTENMGQTMFEKHIEPHDTIFFAEIKRMNDANEHGSSKIIQVTEDTAILIYWHKSHWDYGVYPFQPMSKEKK